MRSAKSVLDYCMMSLMASSTPQQGHSQIVIVDHHEQSAKLLSLFLQISGYRVATAAKGKTGLDLISMHEPAVIFCELDLPDVSGLDLVKTIGESMDSYQPLIFSLSSAPAAAIPEHAGQIVFHDHFVKPLKLQNIGGFLKCLPIVRSSDNIEHLKLTAKMGRPHGEVQSGLNPSY